MSKQSKTEYQSIDNNQSKFIEDLTKDEFDNILNIIKNKNKYTITHEIKRFKKDTIIFQTRYHVNDITVIDNISFTRKSNVLKHHSYWIEY